MNKILPSLIAATVSFSSFHETSACITVTTDTSVFTVNATSVWSVYTGAVDYAFANSNTDGILGYPSTRQVREWTAVMAAPYTVMALADESALEFFGREETSSFFRVCRPKDAAEEALVALSALETFTYTYLWSLRHYVPAWKEQVDEYAALIGADLSACPDTESFDCGTNTPLGFARLMFEQTRLVFDQDGWNANGNLTAANNVLEYEDWRDVNYNENDGYLSDCTEKWKPLYEEKCVSEEEDIITSVLDSITELTELTDQFSQPSSAPEMCWKPVQLQLNLGTYRQQWLYPHIAEVGRSYFVGNEKICELEMDYPCYDFADERQAVLQTLAELDDEKKAKVEFYQNVWQWFMLFQRGLWDTDTDTTEFNKIRGVTSTIAALVSQLL